MQIAFPCDLMKHDKLLVCHTFSKCVEALKNTTLIQTLFGKSFKVTSECMLLLYLGKCHASKPVAIYICVTSTYIRHAGLHCIMKAVLLYSNLYLFISDLL